MNLFVIYIGGKTINSNIEVHDIRFGAAGKIQELYPKLRAEWWGTPESLHLDCWGVLEQADGFDLSIRTEPAISGQKLYFLNLGGYNPTEFTELHRNIFIVADDAADAKQKALSGIKQWGSPHRDIQIEVETNICVSDQLIGNYIHLTRATTLKEFKFVCQYKSIALR